MGILDLFVIGVGLSMDAFAVAICKGLGMHRINLRHAFVIALFFGGFQALMPLIGFFLGSYLAEFVNPIDHWIAFGLLAFIGAKMLWDAFKPDADDGQSDSAQEEALDLKELLMLAVATSIDALAVGITFAFLEVNIWIAITVIGLTTFALSFAGVVVGNRFGARYERPSTIVGGIVLIGIGVKILLEHLGVIAF